MQLLECIVKKPGLLENVKLNFDKRISIVYGKNESGKTLIAKGLIDTIWGEFSGSYSLNGNTWNDLYVEIAFNNFSKKYRFIKNKRDYFSINYSDEKEESSQEKEIIRNTSGGAENQYNDGALSVKLYEATNDAETIRLFNKINIHTFLNTSFLPEPVEIIKNGILNYNIIRRFLLNDSSNFYELYDNLLESFSGDTPSRSNNSISNEIIKIENELKKIEKKSEIAGIHTAKTDRLNKEKARLEAELQHYKKELSGVREYKIKLLEIYENLRKLNQIQKRVEENLKEKQIEQEKIEKILKLEKDIKDKYPNFFNFEESNIKNLKTIQEAYRQVRDIHEEIENFYLLRAEKKNKFKNVILFINIFSILILAVLFGISSFAYPLQFLNKYKIQFIIGLLTLSISSSAFFLLYYLIASSINGLNRIMKAKSDVEQKLAETLQKNSITLNEYKLEAIYEYLVKYFEEYGEYSISQSELITMKDGLKNEAFISSIENELDQLKNEENSLLKETNSAINSLTSEDSLEVNDPVETNIEKTDKLLQKNYKRIKELKEKISQTTNIISQINTDINKGAVHTDEITNLDEERNNTLNTLSRLSNYKITIEYLTNLLKDATKRREDKQLAELVKTTGQYFHYLTNNQYIDTINEDYVKKIIKNELHDIELNASLLHLLMLSMKFAVTNTFSDFEINLPLIIDDPFTQMDDQRVMKLKDLANEIADKRQIIIFTHDSKHKDIGAFLQL